MEHHAKPFVWTGTADEIAAKVRWVEGNVKELVANNSTCDNSITAHCHFFTSHSEGYTSLIDRAHG